MKKEGRRNIIILFFALVVTMIGFGIILPILPFYMDNFGASGKELGILFAIFAAMQFIFGPVWGRLSDRYGRKPMLILGVFGEAVSMLLFGLSTQLWMLFASRALGGALSAATLPVAMAYIGDSTSEDERGGGMGMMGAALGVGMILGPGLGGLLASGSLSLPFFIAAGLLMFASLSILLLLPESLSKKGRMHHKNSSFQSQFGDMWRALFGPMGFLLLLSVLITFALTNFQGIFGLYALERYGYGPERVGTIFSVIGITIAVVQGALTGPLTRRWGEVKIIRASLFSCAIGYILMLQAQAFPTVLLTVGSFILPNALLRPSVASLISKRATMGQGVTMGLYNSFMSLGRIIGPLWAGFVFDINIGYPYLSGAVMLLISFVSSLVWLSIEPVAEKASARI